LWVWARAAKPKPFGTSFGTGSATMQAILPILIFIVAVAAINFYEFHRID
jgi:hypothetical protein